MGRKLIHGGGSAEIHHYLPGFVEKVISRDDLNNIPGVGENASLPLCAIVRTGHKNRGFAKVLGLHLTEKEYEMVQMLNFDGAIFKDVRMGKDASCPSISILKKEYRNLAGKVKLKEGPKAHVYTVLGMTEEEMIALGKDLGDKFAQKLGIPRITAEGINILPEGGFDPSAGRRK